MSRRSLILAVLVALMPATAADACQCVYQSLQRKFDGAENVFAALITGSRLLEDGNSEIDFSVIDQYKGEIPFSTMLTTGAGSSCQTGVHVGYRYVFFQSKSDRLRFCPLIEAVDGWWQDSGEETMQALRDYVDGRILDLSEPWRFSQQGSGCDLSRRFTTAGDGSLGSLTFSVVPPASLALAKQTDPCYRTNTLAMEFRVSELSSLGGPEMLAEAGDTEIKLLRCPNANGSARRYRSVEPAVRDLVESIRSTGVLTAWRSTISPDGKATVIKVTRGQEDIERFLSCLSNVSNEPSRD